MVQIDVYSGEYADEARAINQAIESRLFTTTLDGRPYAFEFNTDDLLVLEEKIAAALRPDSDWYVVTNVHVDPPTITLDVRRVRD